MIGDLLLKIRNRKLVVLLAPVIGGFFLGSLLVVKPSLVRLAAIKAEKDDLSRKESIYNNVVAQEKKLFDQRQRLSKMLDKAKFIEELNTLAGRSGLTVLSMIPEEKVVTAVYLEKIGVKIGAEGNYHQLGEFISRVENLEQFAKVINVFIDTEASREDTGGQQDVGMAARTRASKNSTYKISLVIGLFYPAKDVF